MALIPVAEFVDTEDKALECLLYVMKHQHVGVDTETTGLHIAKDFVLFWSLATDDRRFTILADFLPIFAPFFADPSITKHFTNHKFDRHMLANTGVDFIEGPTPCTLVLDWLLDENRFYHGLKECVWDHLGRRMPTFKDVFGKQVSAGDQPKRLIEILNDVQGGGRDAAVDYAARDAWETLQLSGYLQDQLAQIQMDDSGYNLYDHYWENEEPFGRVLWNMERRGVMINVDYLDEIRPDIESAIEDYKRQFNRAAGSIVNLASPKQLQALFFDKLMAMPTKFTASKAPSTDKEVLEAWADGKVTLWDGSVQYDIEAEQLQEEAEQIQNLAQCLLDYRGLSKFLSTYVNGLQKLVDDEYRLHCTLNHHGTVSGRLSASKPNLQNIPRKDNDRFNIRGAFLADGGNILFVADYEQLEMRILAHLSEDPNMLHAIRGGVDLHGFTVSKMNMGFTIEEVAEAKAKKEAHQELSKREAEALAVRSGAKAVGFGLIYGRGPAALGRQLGLPIIQRASKDGQMRDTCPEAAKLIKAYFGAFPKVRSHIYRTHADCANMGFVQTYSGRFRRLPAINSSNPGLRAQAKRQAVNTEIQGTAADIAKAAMVKCENDKDLQAAGVLMLLQIHDELMFEMPDKEDIKREAKERIEHHMEYALEEQLLVDTPAPGGFGVSWSEAK